ncbi:hypothetical protein COLO4_20596 [Corchorus olitorius]|uniref:Uncharacterized protein n=1 Tax=Corchorus olitorius TaxID=93759 RepID=A0A1R3IYR3_9ROSI|nr:hypothetical protein COLO4_20596 [Corchorus olitorius]
MFSFPPLGLVSPTIKAIPIRLSLAAVSRTIAAAMPPYNFHPIDLIGHAKVRLRLFLFFWLKVMNQLLPFK